MLIRQAAYQGLTNAIALYEEALLDEEAFDAVQPMEKVRRCQVLQRRNSLHRVAELVNRPGAEHVEHDVHAEDMALPPGESATLDFGGDRSRIEEASTLPPSAEPTAAVDQPIQDQHPRDGPAGGGDPRHL